MEELIARAAEAIIKKSENSVIKSRIEKNYRHSELDKKIRTRRTRAESKLLIKAGKIVPVPEVTNTDEKLKEITMQFLDGEKLADNLENKDYKLICDEIGSGIAKLHNEGIIHGDLTTSNLILKDEKVYFIDFGLGFHSDKVEDKATDLHVIKEALDAKHPEIFEESWNSIIKSYEKNSNNSKQILKRLEAVEKRGRYKAQY